jgi:plasmid stability protein
MLSEQEIEVRIEALKLRAARFRQVIAAPPATEAEFRAILDDLIEPVVTKPYQIEAAVKAHLTNNPPKGSNIVAESEVDDAWLSQDGKRGTVRFSRAIKGFDSDIRVVSILESWVWRNNQWFRIVGNSNISVVDGVLTYHDLQRASAPTGKSN